MSLRSYLAKKQARKEVINIGDRLSPRYEIPALIKEYDGQGPLIFRNPEGHKGQVVANICDSRDSICNAMGVTVETLHEHLVQAMENPTPSKIIEGNESTETKLSQIPILTHYKGEQGPYITSALVYAKNPSGEGGNVSYHRMDVIGENRLSICIQPGHLKEYLRQVREAGGEHLDVSISIGNHPTVMIAAALSPPLNVSEYDVANTLLGGGLKLFRCPSVDAVAPVEAEMVLEGRILVNEEATEGPYVCVTGTMKESKPMPVIEIMGTISRTDYIYQGLLGGSTEHRLLESIPNEVKLYKHLKKIGYDIKGIHMTPGGSSWLHCILAITKNSEKDVERVLRATFHEVPALKHVIIVDDDINPYDLEEVEWALATRFQGDRDLHTHPDTYASRLDPSSDLENKRGCKLGMDATVPLGESKERFYKGIIPTSNKVKRILKS